jgi:hypothetical protein
MDDSTEATLDAFTEGGPDPDDDPDKARVCIVAAVDYTFEQCRNGFYPAPVDYPRTEREFGFMAFYRTEPTSAITHYAPVTDQFVDDGSWMGEGRYERLIGRFSDAKEATVFELGELRVLHAPVENDENGVRGAWYTTLGRLKAAGTLSDLADAERTP